VTGRRLAVCGLQSAGGGLFDKHRASPSTTKYLLQQSIKLNKTKITMKKTILSIVMALPLAMLVSCGGEKPAETTVETTTEQAAVINTTHAYVCPMNCENSARNEPGQCVVCGMDLVKNANFAGATTDTTGSTAQGDSTKMMEGSGAHDDHEGHNH